MASRWVTTSECAFHLRKLFVERAGMAVEEFDSFGPTIRTLRPFVEACHELEAQIREFMLLNPDRCHVRT